MKRPISPKNRKVKLSTKEKFYPEKGETKEKNIFDLENLSDFTKEFVKKNGLAFKKGLFCEQIIEIFKNNYPEHTHLSIEELLVGYIRTYKKQRTITSLRNVIHALRKKGIVSKTTNRKYFLSDSLHLTKVKRSEK